jgi:hypothetical protein
MRLRASWLLPLLALAACETLAVAPPADGGATGGSIATGGSAGGSGIECVKATSCPGQDTACRVRTCVDFVCGFEDLPQGTVSPFQVAGDCVTRVCDGAGHLTLVADPLDILDDGNACTRDLCAGLAPRNEPWVDQTCGASGACDGHGNCAACVISAQCGTDTICVDNRCVPTTCLDGVKNGYETALDCGGPSCVPCAANKPCLRDRDCLSDVCDPDTKLCAASSCGDGKRNGAEADVDCGGPCALLCAAGARCGQDADCLGGRCSGSICLPSCVDGVKNGAETGLDCGGGLCAPCGLGAGCQDASDCGSGYCQRGICVAASCVDGEATEGETDVDCGGACAPCSPGKGCVTGADCESAVCAGTICASASCTDHARNAEETGVDCGGPKCARCPNGQGCATHDDCDSGVCSVGVCVSPSCSDGVQDNGETDVDCGGGVCPLCGPTRICAIGGDCASTVCLGGACTAARCDDGIKNGDETSVDCGGLCPPCAIGDACGAPEDCETIACSGGVCVAPACDDHVRNGDETGVDCGGPTCGKCPGGQGCATASDCASGTCDAGVCASSCTDGVKDGDETGVDCGGSCPGCPTGGPCEIPSDCDSDVCVGGSCVAATCSDGVTNGDESDADCGGSTCVACATGKHCNGNSDCLSLGCRSGVCEDVLLISEVRSNGPNNSSPIDDSFADEIVEFYNPGNAPIVLDSSWLFYHRSAQGSCQGKYLRYKGKGAVIPAHGHFLLGGLAYAGPPVDDTMISDPGNSIADAASLWIERNGTVVDALCYFYDTITFQRLTGLGGCVPDYICEGVPVSNLPHDGTKGGSSSVDVSLERKPGGAFGNGQDTGDSSVDFQTSIPSNPQSISSPPTP